VLTSLSAFSISIFFLLCRYPTISKEFQWFLQYNYNTEFYHTLYGTTRNTVLTVNLFPVWGSFPTIVEGSWLAGDDVAPTSKDAEAWCSGQTVDATVQSSVPCAVQSEGVQTTPVDLAVVQVQPITTRQSAGSFIRIVFILYETFFNHDS